MLFPHLLREGKCCKIVFWWMVWKGVDWTAGVPSWSSASPNGDPLFASNAFSWLSRCILCSVRNTMACHSCCGIEKKMESSCLIKEDFKLDCLWDFFPLFPPYQMCGLQFIHSFIHTFVHSFAASDQVGCNPSAEITWSTILCLSNSELSPL